MLSKHDASIFDYGGVINRKEAKLRSASAMQSGTMEAKAKATQLRPPVMASVTAVVETAGRRDHGGRKMEKRRKQ